MRKPSFEMMRAEFDGFLPEKNKPSKHNIRAFLKLIVQGVVDQHPQELKTWDDVLWLTYNQIAFFRVYYCGEDPSSMPKFLKQYASDWNKNDVTINPSHKA